MHTSYDEIALRLSQQFKIDVDDYFVRTHSIQALNEMGLLETDEVLYKATIKDQCVKLPNGSYTRINWVIQADPQLQSTVTISIQNIWFPSQVVFTPVPNEDNLSQVSFTDDLKVHVIPAVKGPYIPFIWKCPVLKFNETERDVIVYAEKLKTDDTGLPPVPEDALEACLYYCLFVWYQPLFLLGKIDSQRFSVVEQWVGNRFSQCQNRIGFKQLDNGRMSEVHSVMTSMDRKATNIDS